MSAKKIGEVIPEKFMTSFDSEDAYVLTKTEEDRAIQHAIERAKEHRHWRFRNEFGLSEMETLSRLSQIDFNEEIKRDEVLRYANSCKVQELWLQERKEKSEEEERKKKAEVEAAWSAKRIFQFMRWTSLNEFQRPLIVNENNKHLITALCFFISNDERFETELNFSFKKGLLIRGTVGLGKTYLAKCVAKNEINPILILSMLEIADELRIEGEYEIKIGNNKMIYLDDVGSEEATVTHYGTKINFFKNFIEQCYLRNKTFGKLLMSTNNSFSEIEAKYGFRVRSRIKEMFNVIDVKGPDLRG